jgi:hypothetical protein
MRPGPGSGLPRDGPDTAGEFTRGGKRISCNSLHAASRASSRPEVSPGPCSPAPSRPSPSTPHKSPAPPSPRAIPTSGSAMSSGDLSRRRFCRPLPQKWAARPLALAAGPGHRAPRPRGPLRRPGGRGGPRPHRREVPARPGADRPELRRHRAQRVPRPAARRRCRKMPAGAVARALQRPGLLKARGRQRTDATDVRASVRTRNRLELRAETPRSAR